MVYCSGLESQCQNPQETSENAQICGSGDANCAPFTDCSEASDGAKVGTLDLGMSASRFIELAVYEYPQWDFDWLRRRGPKSISAKYTYFAQCEASGAIKIGRAFDPEIRMVQLTSKTKSRHRLLATVRGGDNESSYHVAFSAHRLQGEWFAPHPDILAEIERIKDAKRD